MKKSLDSNILQTKTAETIIDLLKKAREITKDNTNYAKGINKDIDFIINKIVNLKIELCFQN